MERDKQLYELGSSLSRSIRQKDYETIVNHYNTARQYAADAKKIADGASSGRQALSDDQIHRILITGRMWDRCGGNRSKL